MKRLMILTGGVFWLINESLMSMSFYEQNQVTQLFKIINIFISPCMNSHKSTSRQSVNQKNKVKSATKPPCNEYRLPTKKRNLSTLVTQLNSLINHSSRPYENSCCRGHGKSQGICQNCLKSIATIVDGKENIKTVRRSGRKLEKSSSEVKKNCKLNISETKKKISAMPAPSPLLDKYAQVKMKEVINCAKKSGQSSKQIASASSIKVLKAKNSKLSSRQHSKIFTQEQAFQIHEINPFIQKAQIEIGSPSFHGSNKKILSEVNSLDEAKQFSFEMTSCKSKATNHYQKIIADLKDTNEKLKQNLFQSFEKYSANIQANHQHIKQIQQQNTSEKGKLVNEAEEYRLKWRAAQKKCEQKEDERKQMNDKNRKQRQQIQNVLKQEIRENKEKAEKHISELMDRLNQRAQMQEKLTIQLNQKQENNELLKEKLSCCQQEIRSLKLQVQKLQIDNEGYKRTIEKFSREKQIIRQNSQTVIELIRKEIVAAEKEEDSTVVSRLINHCA